MTRFIIFHCLLLLPFTLASDVVTVEFRKGSGFQLLETEHSSDTESCIVISNTGRTYNFESSTTRIENDVSLRQYSNYCGISFERVSANVAGTWKILVNVTKKEAEDSSVKLQDESELKYDRSFIWFVKVAENVKVIPSNEFKAYPEHYVRAQLDVHLENQTSCQVTDPNGTVIDLMSSDILPNGLKRIGACGVQVPARYSGTWKLAAMETTFFNGLLVYYNDFFIKFVNSTAVQVGDIKRLRIGDKDKITAAPADAIYCQMQDPNGVTFPLQAGQCGHDVPIVTKRLEGTWIARYGMKGSQEPLEIRFNVSTYGNVPVNGTVTYDTSAINVLCTSLQSERISEDEFFCRFTSPNGTLFNMSPGLGFGRYMYFGEGNEQAPSDGTYYRCGVTITDPVQEDYGAWKCELGRVEAPHHTLVEVEPPADTTGVPFVGVTAKGSVAHIIHGRSFLVKCTADAVLSYCALRSPNGTDYFVAQSETVRSKFVPYEGRGLSLGECAGRFEQASDVHEGDWQCFMGVRNGTALSAVASIFVVESSIYAVDLSRGVSRSERQVFTCKTIEDENRSIDYCRWIRPDGKIIYRPTHSRYVASQNLTSCELLIDAIDVNVDVGNWTCVAGLRGSKIEESWATFRIHDASSYETGQMVAIVLGCCVAVVVLVGLTIIAVRRRRCISISKAFENIRKIRRGRIDHDGPKYRQEI